MTGSIDNEFDRNRYIAAVRTIEKYLHNNDAIGGSASSLAGGLSGIALFYKNLLTYDDAPAYRAKLDVLVHRIYAIVENSRTRDYSLYGGLAGVGFALEQIFLNEDDSDSNDTAVTEELDEALLQHLSVTAWQGHFDLVTGLVGAGAYALSKKNLKSRHDLFRVVFAQLMRLAERTSDGICWRTEPRFMGKNSQGELLPIGNFNLGLAHGSPGVVALFADALVAGVQMAGLRRALDEATRWLMQQATPANEGFYGYIVGDKKKARSAWCYGDPGNAIAIVRAGQALNNPDIIEFGTKCGLNAARRPLMRAGVNDHGLCHGSAGLGLIFMTLFRATEHPDFSASAEIWYEKTLCAVESEDGTALQSRSGDGAMRVDFGALTGVSGIGLSLLDRLSPRSIGWSKWLLI